MTGDHDESIDQQAEKRSGCVRRCNDIVDSMYSRKDIRAFRLALWFLIDQHPVEAEILLERAQAATEPREEIPLTPQGS